MRKSALWAVSILLVAGHVAYWYWPREHPGRTARSSPATLILAAGDLPLRAWVAYPHQNLALLADAERGGNWRRGLAQLAGLPPIELPGFGPFPLPPASELAIATDSTGRRLRVAARIYPVMAWVARAAGWVAGNPWLAGGEIEEGGRRLIVAWEGRTWTLRTVGESWSLDDLSTQEQKSPPVLAWLAIGEPVGPLRAGRYRLERNDRHLDLLSAGAVAEVSSRPAGGVLMVSERQPGGVRTTAILGPGQGSLRGVPSAVVLAPQGVELPALPFERLYKVLGIERRRARSRGWNLVASDRLALERGRGLVPGLARAAEAGGLDLAYEVDLDVVRAVSDELERRLEGIPLPALPEVGRWQGAALVLAELGAYDRWTLEVAAADGAVRSRLWRAD